MEHPNYSDCFATNNMYMGENISSPTQNQNQNACLSTPKAIRSITNTKSPLGKIKLKKSKRRECTPAYSPNKGDGQLRGGFCHTEKKCAEYQRLNFDMMEVMEVDSSRISFFKGGEELSKNMQSNPPKRRFISLIEESLNEVSDSYYGVLGSQTTPDTIFKNIFGEDKEKSRSSNSLLLRPSIYDPYKQSGIKSSVEPQDSVYDFIYNILNELRRRNFEILNFMKTQIVLFNPNMSCFELSIPEFTGTFLDLSFDISSASLSADSAKYIVLVPGTVQLQHLDKTSPARFIFDCTDLEVRLSYIEIQL